MVTVPKTGEQTLESIEKALRQASKTVDRLNEELSRANQNKAELVAERLEAFQQLAHFRTRLALVDGVIDDADRLSAQVRTILQARQKTLAALKQRERDAQRERKQLTDRQKTLNKQIERLDAELDAVGEKAKAVLADNPDYSARAKRHAELEIMMEEAAAKAEKSRAEADEKGAPYRDDPLFMYLWERKFGASEYDHTGLIRMLDRWVARLIGYQDARANFAVLTQIPERLTSHAERLRALALAEREVLDTVEADKIEELAGGDLLQKLAAAQTRRDEQISKLEQLNGELLETGKQLKIYAEGLDPSFKEAVGKTSHFLESQSLGEMRSEAQDTPDVADDEIVGCIERLASQLKALEDLLEEKREALENAFERKEELLRLAAEFRRARYDRPGTVLEPESDGKKLLELLLQGLISAAEYWMRSRGGRGWGSRPGDSYRRRQSGTFGDGSRRRSSGGPDFRTGGGF